MTEPTFDEIDRVARVLCSIENDDPGNGIFGAIDEIDRNRYRHMAKGAILATRQMDTTNGQEPPAETKKAAPR